MPESEQRGRITRRLSGRGVRCLAAPAGVGLALLIWHRLSSAFGPLPAFITFYPVVMLAALFCGFYQGVVATILSTFAVDYWVFPPRGGLGVEAVNNVIALFLFLAIGVSISGVAGLYRRTRSKAAELEKQLTLRETAYRLRLALEAAHAGAWEWELQTGKNVWSDELWRVYGLPAHSCEPSYSAWEQTIVPEDRERVSNAVWAAAGRGAQLSVEWRVRDPDGSERWLMSRGQPSRDAGGRVVRYMGIVMDVTRRKKAELDLFDADRRKNEFLAMLSHELRNPLMPIKNSLYLLAHVPPGGEQALRAQTVIERQVEQMTRLIDDLLDVTRITRGKIRLQSERLDFNELARRAGEDHRSMFADGGIELDIQPASNPIWLMGDRTRLEQVIGNLLQNAAKFTPKGGKTRMIISMDSVSGQARLSVQDTGSGIAPEVLPRVFEAFTQADVALDRNKGGLGLGLALVKGLVELHGGSVAAQSEGPGKGAQITMSLPLAERSATAPVPSATAPRAASYRVLVVDDDRDSADSLRDALAVHEHVVEVTYDGMTAIAKAQRWKPQIVLCDIGLPGIDGYEVARRFRADPALAHIPLVALTGYAQSEDIAKAEAAGFDRHLAKPPSIDALERLLTEVVGRP